jgi:hypothetical protein
MKCHQIREQFVPLLQGKLPPQEEAVVKGHLESCQACGEEWLRSVGLWASLEALPAGPEAAPTEGLAALRRRLAQEERQQARTNPWVRTWLPLGAGAAAAAALAILLVGPGAGVDPAAPTPNQPEVANSLPPSGLEGLPADPTQLNALLEDLPLYEHLDFFARFDLMQPLLDVDPSELETMLEEVEG